MRSKTVLRDFKKPGVTLTRKIDNRETSSLQSVFRITDEFGDWLDLGVADLYSLAVMIDEHIHASDHWGTQEEVAA